MPAKWNKKRPPRKPRKNSTKARQTEPSTPQRCITSDNIIYDSPGMLTRRRLAMLRGEGTSSQNDDVGSATPRGTIISSSPITKTTTKKMTPKRKRS